jgi:O-antigen/teichoic acid export membrane protein
LSAIRKLAGQTAIYGLSSIVGRLLNYLLVPVYTAVFVNTADYGVVSELYAYVAFFIVILTFGMETTFFRFIHQNENQEKVFSNAFLTLIGINVLFVVVIFLAITPISQAMLYEQHPEFIQILAVIVAVDAMSSLPLARLRAREQAARFATVQLASIFTNIGLNLFFLLVLFNRETDDPALGVWYIFVANLISSLVRPALLWREFVSISFQIDAELLKRMCWYALPIVVAGFAGIVNETLDRILLKQILNDPAHLPEGFSDTPLRYAESQVGIYSANYKLAMLITIFLQAFRYAAEPFFFAQAKDDPQRKVYGKVMNYLIIALSFCFLFVSLNLDVFKHFIRQEAYWEGLRVVPVLLVANIFLGVYMSQSIWYKLSGQTKFGAYISIFGATATIVLLVSLIPGFGYMAAAWTTLLVYGGQMVASYLLGQRHYPIRYNLRKAGFYFGWALVIYGLACLLAIEPGNTQFLVHNGLIALYLLPVFVIERKR